MFGGTNRGPAPKMIVLLQSVNRSMAPVQGTRKGKEIVKEVTKYTVLCLFYLGI